MECWIFKLSHSAVPIFPTRGVIREIDKSTVTVHKKR